MHVSSMLRVLALGAVLSISGAPAAPGAEEPVDLELVLAIDVSRSVDPEEARLQREGYVAAFSHRSVFEAVRSGFLRRIAVMYFEWAGWGHNKIIVDWTLIDGERSARAFAVKLAEVPLARARRTSISSAIDFALPLFDDNGFDGTRRVMDISGDGPNNMGRLVTEARDQAVAAGITINGLPIINGRPSFSGWPAQPDLDLYYVDCVIGGPGAFVVVANGIKDYAAAILRKLILEIAAAPPPRGIASAQPRPTLAAAERTAPPCDVGERRFDDQLDDF